MCIFHQDLKLGTLFVDNYMQVKICDYGTTTKLISIGQRINLV